MHKIVLLAIFSIVASSSIALGDESNSFLPLLTSNEEAHKVAAEVVIPETILAEIKNEVATRHRSDYSTQLFLINREKDAYRELAVLASPEDIEEGTFAKIVEVATGRHPKDYSTRLFVIEQEVKAYRSLARLEVPRDVPSEVFHTIAIDVAKRHADSYSTMLFVLNNQIKSYRKMQAQ